MAVEGEVEMTCEKETIVGIVLFVCIFTLRVIDDMCGDGEVLAQPAQDASPAKPPAYLRRKVKLARPDLGQRTVPTCWAAFGWWFLRAKHTTEGFKGFRFDLDPRASMCPTLISGKLF
jgi:hypothetical protein